MIPIISISQLKATRADEMKSRSSCIVESDGEFLGVFIIAPEFDMKQEVISKAGIIEAGRDRDSWNQD